MRIRITDLVQKGQGIGRCEDGRVIFVSGALPGELVDVQVTREKKDFLMGNAVSVIESSPDRTVPVCPLYGICGGCNLMHLRYEVQLSAKKKIFLDTLHQFHALDKSPSFQMEAPASGKSLGYRTRVRFEIKDSSAGFFRSGSNEFVAVQSCPVLDPEINALLVHPEKLAAVANGGEAAVCMSSNGPLLGRENGFATIMGKTLPVSNSVFFQSNLSLLPEMIDYIVSLVQGENVMDLFSGIGTFSAFLEDHHKVIAVERDPHCLALARMHLKSTEFFTRSVEDFKFTKWAQTIIVDPPRTGLDKKVPAQLGKLGASRIIYASCDSVTFARDAALFSELGYALTSSRIFDFYPQTSHMESVNVLDRRTGK